MLKKLASALLVTFLSAPGWSVPVVLFDNLYQTQGGGAAVTSSTWQAQQFSTSIYSGSLTEAVLSIAESTTGGSQLDIYTSVANAPGTLVGSLTNLGGYSSTFVPTTYAGAVTLTANTAYFVVLHALGSGQYNWGFTLNNAGSGAGFEPRWSQSTNAGVSWTGGATVPYQMSLLLETADAPELSTSGAPVAFCLMAGLLLATSRRKLIRS